MEAMSDCGSVPSVGSLHCKKFVYRQQKKNVIIITTITIIQFSFTSVPAEECKLPNTELERNIYNVSYITKHTLTTLENTQQKTGLLISYHYFDND